MKYLTGFGSPQTIILDRGDEFNIEAVKDWLKRHKKMFIFQPLDFPNPTVLSNDFILHSSNIKEFLMKLIYSTMQFLVIIVLFIACLAL